MSLAAGTRHCPYEIVAPLGAGGPAVRICAADTGRGGWWAEDNTIVFGQLARPRTTLMRVPAAGGTPISFGAFSEGANNQRWPQVLPGGTHVLYTEHSSVNRFDYYANLVVVPLPGLPAEASAKVEASAKAGTPKIVARGGSYGRYVAIGPNGYLTYVRQSTLMAMPFDLSRLEAIGPAVPVVEDVEMAGAGGSATVVVSPDGTLMYLPNTSDLPTSPIHWLSRDGKSSVLRDAATRWWGLRLSPDGQQLALAEWDKQRRIFAIDLARGVPKQVTVAHLEAWPSNPLSKGSYTCYRPGQFTTIAGYEGRSAGPLHFEGEHANSFYDSQGFMEGAALSGLDAAKAVLALA